MKWYSITSKTDKAEIWIYEFIGKDFWTGEGLTAKDFQKDLAEIKASQIDLHINSPGGDVFDGNTIYNLLKQHSATITTYIDGLAASIASVIALAGDKIFMAENALFMIHNPQGGLFVFGDEQDIEKESGKILDILRKVKGSIINTYVKKANLTEDEIKTMMNEESWLSANEAIEAGFVDEIVDKIDMAACAKFIPFMAKAGFKHIPNNLTAKRELPSEKDLERALRDVGCSVKQAKTILAKGYSVDLRYVGQVDKPPLATVPLRDVEKPAPARKDRVSDLLIRAEITAPSMN